MDRADDFIRKSKKKMQAIDIVQPHSVPRLNLHGASNSSATKRVLEDILNSSHHKDLGYVSTYPVPIGPAVSVEDSIVKGIDPVLKLVKDKHRYKVMYEKVLQSKAIKALTLQDIDELSTAASKPSVAVNPSILELAWLWPLDPDPHFASDYNSYYGGNVAVTEIGGRISIIHPELDKPSELRLVSVMPDGDRLKNFEVNHVSHLMDNSPIYQIDCSSDLILLRQKKSCGLLKFGSNEELTLEKVGIVKTPDVFVSSAFNTFKEDEFATVAPNSAIEIHDVHGKTKRSVEVEGIKDNWGRVHFHDQNVLMFSDRDTISLCDLRESGADSLQWEVKNQTEECDDVFAATKGKFLHYVCTKHHLLSLDIREGFHQRWTHGLPHAPCLLSVAPNDTLLIGCQSSSEIVYVKNSACGDFTPEFLLPPFRLPHPRETLHMVRTEGVALSPVISSRFSLSLTGLTSFSNNEGVHAFSCNSVGDLFAQSIINRRHPASLVERLHKFERRKLRQWEAQCLEHYSKQIHDFCATSVRDVKYLEESFGKKSDRVEPPSPRAPANTNQPWNMSKQRLMKFKDLLAPKLLAHWNIEDDDEWCDDVESEPMSMGSTSNSSEEQEDIESRIQMWLEKSVDKSIPDPTESEIYF